MPIVVVGVVIAVLHTNPKQLTCHFVVVLHRYYEDSLAWAIFMADVQRNSSKPCVARPLTVFVGLGVLLVDWRL